MDVEQLLRLKGAVEGSVNTEARNAGEGLVASYPRIRAEVSGAVDEQGRAEFDRLFPTELSTAGRPWVAQAEEVKLILSQMAGWLEGIINGVLLDRRIVAEAEAKAAEEAKRVGFS